MVGQSVGHYRILEKLGDGGMGVVYKALDAHLDRFVAIKVMPAGKVADADRRRRFAQEAKAASALKHPNIITIYDIAFDAGQDFIAMEYVAGKTLEQLIGRKALPVKQALKYAIQVADALARAHAAGIVHRDLKPSNIMVDEQGLVKLLDFGVAKLTENNNDEDGPTQTLRATTEEGMIVGTVAYMSPEQAQGRKVDARSDIFAFGAVLYEMFTGCRAFRGDATLSVLSAILTREPPPLPESTPAELQRVVARCLRKDPERRSQNITDVKILLEELKEQCDSGKLATAFPVHHRRPQLRWVMGGLAALLLMLAGIGWYLHLSIETRNNPLAGAHFSRMTNFDGAEAEAVVSADGKFVAFVSDRDGPIDVWITQVGSGQFTNLTKGRFPRQRPYWGWQVRPLVFSADGTQVALLEGGRTWLVPVMGGTPRLLLESGIEAMWSPDGKSLVYHSLAAGDPIFVANANGSNPKQIFADKSGAHCHYPTWSPDGRFIYFARGYPTVNEMDLWRVPSNGGEAERMTHHKARVAYPAFLDNQTMVYSATSEDGPGSVLYAMDLGRRVPRLITTGVQQYSSISVSSDGMRIVVTESNPTGTLWTLPFSVSVQSEAAIRWFELPTVRAVAPRFGRDYLLYLSSMGGADGLWKFKDGAASEIWNPGAGGLIAAPAVSASGRQICFVIRKEGRTGLYRMDESGASPTHLAPSLHVRGSPSWSPDGAWIAISGDDGRRAGLFKVPAEAGGTPVRLRDGICFDPIWSPDGRLIIFSEPLASSELRLSAVAPDGTPVAVPELRVTYRGGGYRFMPGDALGKTLLLMRGGLVSAVDLTTGMERRVAELTRDFVSTFDVSLDGRQMILDRIRENSDVVLIEPPKSLSGPKR